MPAYMLHNELQHEWSGRQLVFFRVKFSVAYETERLLPPLCAFLRENEALSVAIYEILGEYDLLIRAWIPQGIHPEVLAEAITDNESLGISECPAVPVSKIIYHWPWMTNDYGKYLTPHLSNTPATLGYKLRLNNTLSGNTGGLTEEEIDNATSSYILAPIGPDLIEHRGDIKFVTFLSRLDNVRHQERKLVRNALAAAFRDIVRSESPLISQLSLYETRGSAEASFIVLGRFRQGSFYEGFQRLLSTVVETGFRSFFLMKPNTYIMASPEFVRFWDAIPVELSELSEASEGGSLIKLLKRDEGNSLEYKASFYFDVRRWLLDGAGEANDTLFISGIAREVVAFLNSPPGGVLVIGALEGVRELNKVPIASRDRAEDVLRALPTIHGKILTGIGLDASVKPLFSDPDRAERHILDRLSALLDAPTLGGLVTIRFHELEGRTLCTLSVRPLRDGKFAYLKEERGVLYHRRGSSTIPLEGSDADEYRLRKTSAGTE